MAHLPAVGALDLGPILRLRAVSGEMALLLAIAASNVVRVTRLFAILSYVILGATVAASTRRTSFDIGTLWKEYKSVTIPRTRARPNLRLERNGQSRCTSGTQHPLLNEARGNPLPYDLPFCSSCRRKG